MARVVVLGSSNTDMTVRLPRLPRPGETLLGGTFQSGGGGKGANQAVAARRAGAAVVFLTAVGDDALGRVALERYRTEGIDVTHARVVPDAASGIALIFVDERGENMIGVAPGANARLDPADIDRLPDSVFDPSAVLLASLEVPLATVQRALERARAAGMTTILNPAPVDKKVRAGSALPFVDVLTPNQFEAVALVGISTEGPTWKKPSIAFSNANYLRAGGARAVIVTRGAEGCMLVSASEALVFPAHRVDAVDTVGAGDAFNGALAVALGEGRSVAEAAAWATGAAALAVMQLGAQGALPFRPAIDQLAAKAAPPERIHRENDIYDIFM